MKTKKLLLTIVAVACIILIGCKDDNITPEKMLV